MQRSGVDLSLSPVDHTNGAQVTAVLGCKEDRAFLTKRDGAAVPRNMLNAFSASKARHLHIGELATLQELPELLEIAKANGMTTSLDCAWDESCLANENVHHLIAQVDLFLPNKMEAEYLGYLKDPSNCPTLTVVKKRNCWRNGPYPHWRNHSLRRTCYRHRYHWCRRRLQRRFPKLMALRRRYPNLPARGKQIRCCCRHARWRCPLLIIERGHRHSERL